MSWQRKFLFSSLATATVVGLGIFAITRSRPAMPAEWSELRIGMPREDVLAHLKEQVIDLRELKGFDTVFHETLMLGASGSWRLQITYDRFGKVSETEVQFVHQKFGIFSTKPKILLKVSRHSQPTLSPPFARPA